MKISVSVSAMQLEPVRQLVRAFTSHNNLENYIKYGKSSASCVVIVESYEENFDYGIEFKKFLDSFGLSTSDIIFTGADPVAETVIREEVSIHIDTDASVVTRINELNPGGGLLIFFSA